MTLIEILALHYRKSWLTRACQKAEQLGYDLSSEATFESLSGLALWFKKLIKYAKNYHDQLSNCQSKISSNQIRENNTHHNFSSTTTLLQEGSDRGIIGTTSEMRSESDLQVGQTNSDDLGGRGGRAQSYAAGTELCPITRETETSPIDSIFAETIGFCAESKQLTRDSRKLTRKALSIATQAVGVAATSYLGTTTGDTDCLSEQNPVLEQQTIEVKAIRDD